MHISNFVLFAAIEAFVLVCVIAIVLLLYIARQKKKSQRLQQQSRNLISKVQQLKADYDRAKAEFSTGNAYRQQINDQLLLTREHHKTLEAGQDIALDLSLEAPMNRQIAAFRHAVLIAEKEALHNSEDGSPNWQVLEGKLTQLIKFYGDFQKREPKDTTTATEDTSKEVVELQRTLEGMLKELGDRTDEVAKLEHDLETSHKRINNLEQFKKLFFEMEDQWKDAKQEAQIYYERLMAMRDEVSDSQRFEETLNDYNNVYKEIEKTLISITGDSNLQTSSAAASVVDNNGSSSTTEIHNSEKRAVDELQKLRSLTADQHRLISQLQKKLEQAQSLQEKEEIIQQLQEEINRQISFVKESEVCIQLLEQELAGAMSRARELETELENAREVAAHVPKMQETIRQFAVDSKDMLHNLAELEKLNEQLSGDSNQGGHPKQLAQVHQQLQSLQSQYADLETRYLEVRSSSQTHLAS